MEKTEARPSIDFKVIPIVAVLMSGAFIAILNQTLLATALPHIMEDLDLTSSTVQWLQTIFLLVNGIMIPVTALLTAKFSTRSLYLFAMGLFGAGTLICAVAPGFTVLMAGRILQGAGAGIILPLIQTVLFVIFPVEKRGQAMGFFGLVISFAPAIGPTLSGWLVDEYSWRTLFEVVLPIAVVDLVIAFLVIKNVTEQTSPKIDYLSIVLSTFGFGGLLFGFSSAGNSGWSSPAVLISLLVGAISLFLFISRQFKLKEPILEFSVFKNRVFSVTTSIAAIVFLIMISSATILPIYMQNALGFSALKSGLMLLPGAIVMGILSPVSGRLYDKIGAKKLAIPGLIIASATTFMLSSLSASTTFAYLASVNAVRLLGIGMVMMPVTTAGLNQLPQHLISHGSAMNNTLRQIAGSIGTAVLFTIIAASQFSASGEGKENMISGINASFMVTGFLCLLGTILAFFIKENRKN
ncbi:DHA2 family efflux MFS transporter permease subunit [Bacillus mangrovi]|uniref:DHA2 family efflux MFS transporter permease subunit n=1 Tax=Metabacillus mangrovi TaxID=1491830 RepID=A0A7X2V724_9BACI|nr:MDR family MFS transporter [Metabacillus mangrovi]MTH55543.1 DHA2 family efflux MFS transporter permease subunit [Metabacillus mangrovi]